MSENHIVMLCTVPDHGSGERIAQALVEERLAACVNLVPGVVSYFRWEGKLERQDEHLLVIKTGAARFEAVRTAISLMHPAKVPEVIALTITAGSEEYIKWITENSQ